jgi:hypothetical protein
MNPELIRLIESNEIQIHGDVEYFAELVAAAEREACAEVCDDVCANFYALYKGRPPYTGKENGRGDPIADGASHGAEKCAAAIRARGDE